VELIEARTLGVAWLAACGLIMARGASASYDGVPTREIALLTLVVDEPDSRDGVIVELGDAGWLDWMERNFGELDDVPELGDARSYARRLRDYDGRDQVAWVIERLRDDPASRSATITTLQPLSDTSYIPCVSLLDFWRVGDTIELVVYAHSLDFGKKAYGNLAELARLQEEIAPAVGAGVGRLVVHVKSAHVYEPDFAAVEQLYQGDAPRAKGEGERRPAPGQRPATPFGALPATDRSVRSSD
jgi:thymidylate synthase